MSSDAAGPVLLKSLGRLFAARSPLVESEDSRPLLTNSESGRLGRKFWIPKVSGVFVVHRLVVDAVVTIYKAQQPRPNRRPRLKAGDEDWPRTGAPRVCSVPTRRCKGPGPAPTLSIILHVEK